MWLLTYETFEDDHWLQHFGEYASYTLFLKEYLRIKDSLNVRSLKTYDAGEIFLEVKLDEIFPKT